MWRMSSGSVRSPVNVSRSPSCQAARPDTSCTQRTRSRSASRRMPLSLHALAARGGVDPHRLLGQDRRAGDLGRGQGQHGRAPGDDLLVGQAVLASLGENPQRHRRAGHEVAAGVGEHAHEDLVRVQRTQDEPAAVEHADQLPARQLGERRDVLEVGVGAVEEVLGEPGQRGAEAPDPPGPAQVAGGGDRVQLVERRVLGLDLAREAQVDGDVPIDADDDVAGVDVGLGGGPGEEHGLGARPRGAGGPRGRARAR